MPCTYYTADEYRAMDGEERARLKRELDRVTALLCELTSRIPKRYITPGTELEDWVAEHAEMDRKRKEAEAKAAEEERKRKEEAYHKDLAEFQRLKNKLGF